MNEVNIADIVPQIIWTNDGAGRADYFNERWYEYTGLTFEKSQGPGWLALAHEDDKPAIEEWERAFSDKRPFEAQARLRSKDGQYEWHLLRNVPFVAADKNLLRWYGTATNIQKIRDAEDKHHLTSTYLKAVLDAAIDFSIIILNGNGNIIGWNRGAAKMFGYQEEEILGKSTDILFTEEDRQGGIPFRELDMARKTGRSLDERWHLRKDGSRFFMSGVLTPLKNYDGFVKITRNITDRKLAEEALLLAEHRNNVALQSGKMGEWTWYIQSESILLDDKSQTILGVPQSSLKLDEFRSMIHPDDIESVEQEFEKCIAGLNVCQKEFRITRKESGETIWINWYGRVVMHKEETAQQISGVVYDITERKQLEKHKDEFVSVASHELKTPLTSMKAYAELLEDVLLESGQTEHSKLVQKLNIQMDRLLNLFNVLLDTTRVSDGRLKINPVKFDINARLEECIDEFARIAPAHRLVFKPSQVGLIKADRERIGQVINNLIANAIKYSPGGGEVIITSEDAMDGVLVKVQDFGIGIGAEDQANLFKQYFRGSGTQASSQPGFGLGLYISAEIIRQHHGLIGAESQLGKGSTFYFKLFYS